MTQAKTTLGVTNHNDMPSKTTNKSHLLHRSFKVQPNLVKSGSGVYLHLDDGRVILDACAGAAVALLGHGNEEVVEAMTQQARSIAYVHTQSYTTDPAEELAYEILEGNPYGLEKAFFCGSGSEAVDSAMKLARQYFYEKGETQRVHFVSRRQSYHGNSIGSMNLSGVVWRKAPYKEILSPHASQVSPPFSYRYQCEGETLEDYSNRLIQELKDEFLRVGAEKIIAFVAEPVIGATAGCVTAPPGYFKGVRDLCDAYGILLIMDEVMCGIGRTGSFFAFEQEGVVPDILTVAKGLGGGYAPIAGVLIHQKVIQTLKGGSSIFNHGHTYQAHPISCATALAVQRIVKREGLIQACARMGHFLERTLRHELRDCRSVGDIRGRGLFWAVEFVQDTDTKEPFNPQLGFGNLVQKYAFERGLAVYPGWGTIDGARGDHVLLAPPFIISEDEITIICQRLREAIMSQEQIYLRR